MKALIGLSVVAALAGPPLKAVTAVMNGVEIRFTTRVAGNPSPSYGSGVRVKERLYREISDRGRLAFGYEVEVSAPDAGGRVRLTLKPLGSDYLRDLGSKAAALGVDPQHLPTFTQAREVAPLRPGQSIMFELLTNPTTKESVADSIEILGPPTKRVDEFGFDNVKVTVDGKSEQGDGGVRGDGVVMFYLPGQGSFYFAAKPQPGYSFARIGAVDGKRLTFDLNRHHYECLSLTDILSTSGRSEMWVLYDMRPHNNPLGRDGDRGLVAACPSMKCFAR
jgi:hypothetical protein